MPNTVIARIPYNWNDFGADALTESGEARLISLICKRLPDAVSWCGDELIAPIDFDANSFDIAEIVSAAREELLEDYRESDFAE